MTYVDARAPLLERGDVPTEIAHLENQLVLDYEGLVPEEIVRACVRDALTDLGETRIHHFVPVLVERLARLELARWLAALPPAARA